MLQKPSNYDTVQAAGMGEIETLEPGGYICKIMKAEGGKSKNGGNMLVISFDIAEGDKKGFYTRKYKANSQFEKKWGGVYYQIMDGASTPFFKGVIQAIEESNPGYKFDFDETKLTGKLFGGIFGREELFNASRGEYQMTAKLMWVRNVDVIRKGDYRIPADKLLERTPAAGQVPPQGFIIESTPVDEDDLPF